MPSTSESDDTPVDPRVKDELDTLNLATDEINKLENEISEERTKFKQLLNDATQELAKLGKKYGKWIDRARPYYEALKNVNQAHAALQRAVQNFQKSTGEHRAAKETISIAEQSLSKLNNKKMDADLQEMINNQTVRFMQAEADRTRSEKIHEQATRKYEYLQKKASKIKSKHKISTTRTKHYFERKEKLEVTLQKQRQCVEEIQQKINVAKQRYKTALSNLEKISLEIHEQRQDTHVMALLGDRTDGEGSDLPDDGIEELAQQFDLKSPKSYDDINELEADLEEFSWDDVESDDVSYSSSEDGSVSSESSGRRSLPTSPASRRRQWRRMSSYKRQVSGASIDEDPLDRDGVSPKAHRVRRKFTPPKQDSLPEEDAVFQDRPAMKDNNDNIISKTHKDNRKELSGVTSLDRTYDTLHGVSRPNNSADDRTNSENADYDIFDDLC